MIIHNINEFAENNFNEVVEIYEKYLEKYSQDNISLSLTQCYFQNKINTSIRAIEVTLDEGLL